MIMRTARSPLVWGKWKVEGYTAFVMVLPDEFRLQTVFMNFS